MHATITNDAWIKYDQSMTPPFYADDYLVRFSMRLLQIMNTFNRKFMAIALTPFKRTLSTL